MKLGQFLCGMFLGAALMYAALKNYVVHAHDGLHLVPKTTGRLTSLYVDIREFKLADWDDHRDLALDIANSRKSYLLEEAAKSSLNQAVLDVFEGMGARPTR